MCLIYLFQSSAQVLKLVQRGRFDGHRHDRGKNAEVGANFSLSAFNRNNTLKHETFRFKACSKVLLLCFYVNNAIMGHLGVS